jgi:hypothetical protein
MVDQTPSGDDAVAPVCPWCSAPLPDPSAEACPSCGATLVGGADESVPGLTAVDPGAISRAVTPPRTRSRLLSWLSGESDDEEYTPAPPEALAPPDLEVRREMLRLELQAEVAALQAENDALLAEAAAEGRVVDLTGDVAADADLVAEMADDADAAEATAADTAEPIAAAAEPAPAAVAAPAATTDAPDEDAPTAPPA